MRILDRLRKAEKQGVEAARHGMERARINWDEAESRMRRKMRIHPTSEPRTSAPTATGTAQNGSMAASESQMSSARGERPTPIVSVHGKDVAPDSLKNPAA
jgi:hypothetical protein